jgi:hypothetical protein
MESRLRRLKCIKAPSLRQEQRITGLEVAIGKIRVDLAKKSKK